MNFTEEQNEIFNSNEQVILIKAFAGAGKTTTLKEYAKRRPNSKFLYLAFNTSVVEEAKHKFPSNVNVSTLHSIAFKEFGSDYKKKLDIPFKSMSVINYLSLDRKNKAHLEIAKIIVDTINTYTNSSYTKLEEAIPYHNKYSRSQLFEYAEFIWFAMLDNTNDFPCTHDVYLKLFQLSNPTLNYDYILFDEAQDANPVIVDVIMKQMMKKRLKLVVVGDSHQSIYSFKNAINSLSKFSHDKEYHLSQSFRFGDNIAYAANAILKSLKGEKITLKGSNVEDQLVNTFEKDEKFAIISRTNSCLFLKAVQAVESCKKIHFVSGFNKYNFYKIQDVDHLYHGRINKIRDPHIRDCETYSNFYSIAEHTADKEMLFLKKIVDKYHGKIEALFTRIKASIVDKDIADVILTTAHKSKGLEFDNVFLCNDFTMFINEQGEINLRNWKEEEINILYVAATRAIHKLRPNPTLRNIVKYYKNHWQDGKEPVIMAEQDEKKGNNLNKIKNHIKTIK